MSKEFFLENFQHSINLSKFLVASSKKLDLNIIALDGELGSGKSFLSYQISKILLKKNDFNFSSPSFNIVNIYNSGDFEIYHIDLYRVRNKNQIYNLGIEEILQNASLVLIEWPELILEIIEPYGFIIVKLEILDNNVRKCIVKFNQKK